MGLKTPLYDACAALGARIIDFGGWDLPLSFGSQIEEHHAVRRDAGVFDVSHMGIVDLTGARTREFLAHLLANDVGRLRKSGRALYSCLLLPGGGVIDDLIVYYMSESWFRLVVNAGCRQKDLAWIREHAAPFHIEVRERADLAMLAVQGPNARDKTLPLLPAARDREPAASRGSAPPRSRRGSWRAPDTRARMASRSCCRRGGRRHVECAARAGGAAGRPRRARHAAARGRHEPLRQRHGRKPPSAGVGARLDGGVRSKEPGVHRPCSARERARCRPGAQLVGLLLEDRGVLRSHQAVSAASPAGAAGDVPPGA